MKLDRRRFFGLAAAATAFSTVMCRAAAQSFPTRPITMVVAFGAGGPSDVIGRILAEGMRVSLGQPVIVENIAGASGTIGTGRVARAEPDGYTFILGNWATHVLNGPLFSLQYDLVKDFEPVALISSDALIIVGRAKLPADDLDQFIAWLKQNEGATQGTTGAGGISTVGGLLLQKQTGAKFRFIPYRAGLVAAMQDLIAGRIDFMVDTVADSLPQVRAHTIKAFAVTSEKRVPNAPEVPTVDEAGWPGLRALNWQAAFLPKGTPKPIVKILNESIVAALKTPVVQKRLAAIGQTIFHPDMQTPPALAAFQQAEIEKWWPIIREANLKAD
jgi:tripartite-type tricarboxylate transporter receptor subunit TctC